MTRGDQAAACCWLRIARTSTAYDQEEFARRLHYERPHEASLELFRYARMATAELLECLQPADWLREGTHSEPALHDGDLAPHLRRARPQARAADSGAQRRGDARVAVAYSRRSAGPFDRLHSATSSASPGRTARRTPDSCKSELAAHFARARRPQYIRILLSRPPERLFLFPPRRDQRADTSPRLDRRPQPIRSVEDVDRPLVVLVLVRRLAPREALTDSAGGTRRSARPPSGPARNACRSSHVDLAAAAGLLRVLLERRLEERRPEVHAGQAARVHRVGEPIRRRSTARRSARTAASCRGPPTASFPRTAPRPDRRSALSSVGMFGDGITHGRPVSSKYMLARPAVHRDDVERGADAEVAR